MCIKNVKRCGWVESGGEICVPYHDTEWGVPVHDDRIHFEFIVLDGFQAGLSWSTILRKRERFRQVFDHFDPALVAAYNNRKMQELMSDAGIIRNRLKVEAAVNNARAFLKVQKEYGSFDSYIWRFVNGRMIVNEWKNMQEIPASTPESGAMSRDLKKRGFTFVGPTICYAYMQAAGLVNDHEVTCFRHEAVRAIAGAHGL